MITRAFTIYKNVFTGLSKSVWLLSLVSLINRSGTMVIPFLTVYLTAELGFSLQQAGWVMTVFGLGSVAGTYLGGRLTDKIGFHHVMFWSLLSGGFFFISLGFFQNFWGILAMVFILSIVSEAFRPAAMSSMGAFSEPENRTRSFSLFRMAVNLGWTLGPAVGGWLASSLGYSALFWVDGLTCIAAAVVFRIFLHPKKQVKTDEPEEAPATPAASPFQDKIYLFFLLLTTLGAIAFMQFLSALPAYYSQELHLSPAQIGGLLALNGLMVVLLEMPLIYALEGRSNMMNNIMRGVVLFGLGYLVFNIFGGSIWIAIVSMMALSFGEILNMPFTNTFAMSRTTPANRGSYMGLFTMTYSIAHIFAPMIGMQVAANWGFSTLWYVLTAFCAVSFFGFFFLKKWTAEKSEAAEMQTASLNAP